MLLAHWQCSICHIVNGVGAQVGSASTERCGWHSKQWIKVQIRNPKSRLPETIMPAYNLSPHDMDGVIEYLTVMLAW